MPSSELIGGQIAQWRQETITGLRLVDTDGIRTLGPCGDVRDNE
jgi:hypothetical protein